MRKQEVIVAIDEYVARELESANRFQADGYLTAYTCTMSTVKSLTELRELVSQINVIDEL
jgi:hypothetical protein